MLADDFLRCADHTARVYILGYGETNRQRIDHALILPVSVREATASGGRYTQQDVKVRFPKCECRTLTPEVGGYLEIDKEDSLWAIVGFDHLRRAEAYRVWCRRSVDLTTLASADTVTLQTFDVKKDADLAPYREWYAHADIKAVIQPIQKVFETDLARRRHEATHQGFIAKPTDFSVVPSMRVVSSQETFDIVGVTEPAVGSLMVLDLRLSTSAGRD